MTSRLETGMEDDTPSFQATPRGSHIAFPPDTTDMGSPFTHSHVNARALRPGVHTPSPRAHHCPAHTSPACTPTARPPPVQHHIISLASLSTAQQMGSGERSENSKRIEH